MNQQPVYPGSRQPPPLSNGTRNGSASGPTGVKQPEPLESTQSRAARFEDEKRRIIESCFNKRDPDGMQVESYITHVRVLEDGSYPSSPPPPDAPSANKKSRVILVAVRRSGKVRVHKARENPTGTFSIGKTWNLDELNAIMSYSALVPATPQQQLEKQWGSNTGFTVTLGKPYFWAAPTPKEKDFFIASLIKIYRKYTGGKVPELIGFAPQELAQLTSAPPSAQNNPTPRSGAFSPPVPSDHSSPPAQPPSVPTLSSNRPQSPYTAQQPPPSRDGNRVVSQEQDRSFTRQEYRPATRDGPRPPSQLENRPPPPRQERTTPVPEPSRGAPFGAQFRRDDGRTPSLTDSLQSPPSLPTMNSKPSQSSLQRAEPPLDPQPLRPNGLGVIKPSGLDVNGKRLGPQPSQDSFRSAGRNDVLSGSRPSTATTDRRTPEPPPPMVPARSVPAPTVAELEAPPLQERKGSAASGAEQAGRPSADSSTFVTPMGTPDNLKEEEDQNREANYFANKEAEAEVKQAANNVVPLSNAALEPVAQEDPPSTITKEPVTAEPADTVPPPPIPEEFRPGLGPMVKKKSGRDIANQFRKAALAASAFQPRQGGAGARLKAMQEKQSNEPDGITSVVPAPLFRGMSTDSAGTGVSEVPSPITDPDKPMSTSPASNDAIPKVQIERRATSDNVARSETPVPKPTPVAAEVRQEPEVTASPERARSRSPQRRRRQKLEAEVEKYCLSLGIDPRVTDGRGGDFNELLTEFGWEGRLDDQHKVDDFENDVRREIGRAQASGWLGHVEQQENKVQELSKAFDRAIAECEELDGLLTLYAHELDTLHDDIEYIEAQGQGLQVQTANQKLLQAELESLLKTLTISSGELRPLKAAPIDSFDGLRAIEDSLALLYRAMLTIDPDIRQNKLRQAAAASTDRPGVGVYADTQFGEMLAVKQKKEEYKEQSMMFVNRLNQHMKAMFQMAEQRTSEENAAASISSGSSTTLSLRAYNASRQELWVYNALMLFVREFNQYEWQTLISSYEINVKGIYQDQFRDFAMGVRKTARKPTGEELEILFTHQEKEKAEESLTSTAARKLTVRRVRAQKSSVLRQSIGEKRDGRPEAWSVFDTVLEQQASAISEEQNFIVHFFHANSQSNADFAELVVSRQPDQRKLPNLQAKQSYDPDRNMAKIVQNTTEGIYSFWPMELQAMLDWVVKTDQMQSVGILVSLEQCLAKYEETNQEFITRTVRGLHDRLTGSFHKFIEDQVKAIEETKVKVKKRKGLISFMRVFPDFITAVEDMIPQEFAHQESLEVRFIVNDGYIRLLKAMWESLNFIAKDNPASATGGAHSTAPTSGDPEDKEALNYHILLIENMNYFVEEVKTHHNIVLEEWTERAQRDQVSHLSQYVDAVIRRPLGKWLDFLESTEALMKATDSYTSIANKPSHSRSSAKKVLSAHDTKEIRKGVETLKKRIEKHFTDADDPGSSNRALIGRVFEECAVRYAHAYDRMILLIDRVYEGGLEFDWRKEDAAAIFKR